MKKINENTIKEYKRYLELGNNSKNTIISYLNNALKLIDTFGYRDYNLLNINDLETFIDTLNISDNSKNQFIYSIKNFWKFLYREEYINHNISTLIRKYRVYNKPAKYLNKIEISKCLKYLNSLENNRKNRLKKNLFLTLVYTGIRRNELLKLKIEDIKSDYIIILGKGGKIRNIPVSEDLKIVLDEQIGNRKKGFLFNAINSNSKGLPVSTLVKYIKEIGLQALNKDISVHTLRHTTATLLYESTGDLHAISNILGHENISTTQIYAHIDNGKKIELVNTIKI